MYWYVSLFIFFDFHNGCHGNGPFFLSECSMMPAWHHSDSWCGMSLNVRSAKTRCGYSRARLDQKSLFGCRTIGNLITMDLSWTWNTAPHVFPFSRSSYISSKSSDVITVSTFINMFVTTICIPFWLFNNRCDVWSAICHAWHHHVFNTFLYKKCSLNWFVCHNTDTRFSV